MDISEDIVKTTEKYCRKYCKNFDFENLREKMIFAHCSEMYGQRRNNYNRISKAKNKAGIYFFVDTASVIYIGQATLRSKKRKKWSLYNRVQQHLRRNDSGSRLKEFCVPLCSNNEIDVYILPLIEKECTGLCRQNLLFLESYLIGKYRPLYNFRTEEGQL